MTGLQGGRVVEAVALELPSGREAQCHAVIAEEVEAGASAGEGCCRFARTAQSSQENAVAVLGDQAGVNELDVAVAGPDRERQVQRLRPVDER
jgi:hypothetical protein